MYGFVTWLVYWLEVLDTLGHGVTLVLIFDLGSAKMFSGLIFETFLLSLSYIEWCN